ncbi:hypothetical protein ACFX2J_045625 [Malus domestica]
MLDPKWARTSLHKTETLLSIASRLTSSEPSGKDEGKRLRSARKRRIPSCSCRREAYEWVLLVFDAVDAIGKSSSPTRIAVMHIVGGEEDEKEDVLGGEEVEEELDQWAEEMGESQAKAMKLNLHPLLEQRMEFTQRSAALPSSSQTVTRGRGQGRASGAMATSLLTIHFGYCQARGKIQTRSHEVYNLLLELCNRKQPEEKVPCKH